MELTLIQKIAIWILPLLFAITLHEVAHGWVAYLRGDKTAYLAGRLTINPIKHIDLMGTLVVPLLLLSVSNFVFGWAKPVPVDSRNLKKPRMDMALVAMAGPLSNFVMALFWAMITKLSSFLPQQSTWLSIPLGYMGQVGVMLNVVLAVLNFLPLPPLDGGRVLLSLLPPRMAWSLSRIEPFSFLILIVMLVTGLLAYIISPLVYFFMRVIFGLFGLG